MPNRPDPERLARTILNLSAFIAALAFALFAARWAFSYPHCFTVRETNPPPMPPIGYAIQRRDCIWWLEHGGCRTWQTTYCKVEEPRQ